MKRFLLFLVVAIAVVSLGLTIYYFSTDNEVIRINNTYITLNKNAVLKTSDLLQFENKSEYTTVDYSGVGDSNILSYSENDGYYVAKAGGTTEINIKTSNRHYSNIVIQVTVNDGTEAFPYAIYSEAELRKIGNDATGQFTLDASYRLHADITLTNEEWTPLEEYTGVFDGGNHTIYDMIIKSANVHGNAGFVGKLGVGAVGTAREGKQGVIKNLKLANVNISGTYDNVGAFAGVNQGKIQVSTLVSGNISTEVSGTDSYIGSIAGVNETNGSFRPLIDRCVSNGKIIVSDASQNAGGIAGKNYGGQISECAFRGIAEGDIANAGYHFGGIVKENIATAKMSSDVYDCYVYLNTSDKTLSQSEMGLIIYNNQNNAVRTNGIMGCYYGGTLTEEVGTGIRIGTTDDIGIIDFLTKEEFKFNNINEVCPNPNFISYRTATANPEPIYWNFSNVWYMGDSYPEINEVSELGTSYLISVDSIITNSKFTTLADLHAKLLEDSVNGIHDSYEVVLSDIDANKNFVWEPIDNLYSNLIFKTDPVNPYVIEGLKIVNDNTDDAVAEDVGMFRNIDATVTISGLKLSGTTISGEDGRYVGVLGGNNAGANIYDISIDNTTIDISGETFGTLFGYSLDNLGNGIKNVSVRTVYTKPGRMFRFAGGLVGKNASVITSDSTFNKVNNISLVANVCGGVAGYNQGTIEKTSVYNMKFNQKIDGTTVLDLFTQHFYLGGIVGRNYAGAINNVNVSKTDIEVDTGSNYEVYIGGIAGLNSNGNISYATVYETDLKTTSNYEAVLGGIVGYNAGYINLCYVHQNCNILASTTFVATNVTNGNVTELFFVCSMVGGLVGCDHQATGISINQSVSIATLQGFYVGGLVGVGYGKIEKCSYGFVDGGTDFRVTSGSITGFYAGGMAGIIAGGYIKNSYVFADISGATFTGTAKDWENLTLNQATNMICSQETSAKAGFATFLVGDSLIQNCYTVVNFKGDGINFGTTVSGVHRSEADRKNHSYGTLANSAYQTLGNYNNGGTRLTEDQLKGNTSSQYKSFIGVGFSVTSVWDVRQGGNGYPRLYKIASQLPKIA